MENKLSFQARLARIAARRAGERAAPIVDVAKRRRAIAAYVAAMESENNLRAAFGRKPLNGELI